MNNTSVINQETYETVIQQAVDALQKGQLVVTPTETRYGLLVNASDSSALEKLYEAKKRPEFMPTAIFVNSIEELFTYGYSNDFAKALAKEFLPGPLTLVLRTHHPDQKYVVSHGKIGVRFSSAKLIADILSQVDFPLTATSANISGENECTSVEEIKKEFGDSVSLYIDGGHLTHTPSTVVDISGDIPNFHRIGAISKEQINKIIESI